MEVSASMNNRILSYAQRERVILDYLSGHSFASTEDICGRTGASVATTRRDFLEMESRGLVLRSRGGVQPLTQPSVPVLLPERTAVTSAIDQEKARIAAYAASLVRESDCIFIGAGKTCNLFASYLKSFDHLTVITTNLTAAIELANCPNIAVSVLGGDLHTGPCFIETISSEHDLEHDLDRLYFDKVFITVDGLDLDCGYTIRYKRQIPLYTRLLHASETFYLLLDSSKFDKRSFVPAFDMTQIRHVITTQAAPQTYRRFFESNDIVCDIV